MAPSAFESALAQYYVSLGAPRDSMERFVERAGGLVAALDALDSVLDDSDKKLAGLCRAIDLYALDFDEKLAILRSVARTRHKRVLFRRFAPLARAAASHGVAPADLERASSTEWAVATRQGALGNAFVFAPIVAEHATTPAAKKNAVAFCARVARDVGNYDETAHAYAALLCWLRASDALEVAWNDALRWCTVVPGSVDPRDVAAFDPSRGSLASHPLIEAARSVNARDTYAGATTAVVLQEATESDDDVDADADTSHAAIAEFRRAHNEIVFTFSDDLNVVLARRDVHVARSRIWRRIAQACRPSTSPSPSSSTTGAAGS